MAVEYLSGLAIEDLLEKVARLPKHSVIFYLTMFRDANGKSFVPREIMSVISENDAYARSVGFDNGDKIIGTRFEEFLPLSEQKNIDTLKAWIRGQYSILNAETIESYKEGITRVFLNNTSAVIEDGRVVTVWGTHTDITELKIAEKNLRIAEQKYRTVADFTYD